MGGWVKQFRSPVGELQEKEAERCFSHIRS